MFQKEIQKYQFEVESARSKHWFALDSEWIKTGFGQGEQNHTSECFNKTFQSNHSQVLKYFLFQLGFLKNNN